eukprot:361960-Chlamydomonas_euryale.AAC.4
MQPRPAPPPPAAHTAAKPPVPPLPPLPVPPPRARWRPPLKAPPSLPDVQHHQHARTAQGPHPAHGPHFLPRTLKRHRPSPISSISSMRAPPVYRTLTMPVRSESLRLNLRRMREK